MVPDNALTRVISVKNRFWPLCLNPLFALVILLHVVSRKGRRTGGKSGGQLRDKSQLVCIPRMTRVNNTARSSGFQPTQRIFLSEPISCSDVMCTSNNGEEIAMARKSSSTRRRSHSTNGRRSMMRSTYHDVM